MIGNVVIKEIVVIEDLSKFPSRYLVHWSGYDMLLFKVGAITPVLYIQGIDPRAGCGLAIQLLCPPVFI